MCFGYHKYTHLFWSTDKLGIYHVYRKYTVFCMQNTIIYQSHIKPRLKHHVAKINDIAL